MATNETGDKGSSSNQITAAQNPLFLHPSDSSNCDLVSEILKGSDNYGVWSRKMLTALEAKSKLGFIDGTCKMPTTVSPFLGQWKRCNALIRSWIHKSISRELLQCVVYCDSAYQVWKDLKERFDKVNSARKYALYKHISTLTQGTNIVAEYYSKLTNLWDEYETLIPSPVSVVSKEFVDHCEELKTMQFLIGLNDCYNNVRSQVILISPLPTHGKVYCMICSEETQKGITNSNSDSSSMFFASSNKPGGNGKNPLVCEECDCNGHTKDKCFKIIGYPPN